MASKSQCRNVLKDKNPKLNPKPSQNALADEIALRDEIFELKRQILLLKKANERNLIKVRKYEDEAKKKDRQIEQLMDPVKNGDVRKLLSTKGAALLLNLKEQNNTLIHMLLAKDMQIRKLLSEIKTSKLYTSTKRAESYRSEIDRLRNLLIKSQNTVKESHDIESQQRSVCTEGATVQDVTVSSDQSSPRDLEELHFTIQNLEMHMKYSNELLAKKNEQILQLTDRLSSNRCSSCRRNIQAKYFTEGHVESGRDNARNVNVSEPDFSRSGEYIAVGSMFELTTQDSKFVLNSGSREFHESKRLSVPSAKGFRDYDDPVAGNKQDAMYAGWEPRGSERTFLDNKTNQIRNANPNNCGTEENTDALFPDSSRFSDFQRILEKTAEKGESEESDVDTEEFEMMEKKIENDQTEIESPVKLMSQINACSDDLPKDEKLFFAENKADCDGGTTPASDVNFKDEEGPIDLENENCEGNDCDTPETVCVAEEVDSENSNCTVDLRRYGSDSSFDSQITTGNPVRVEAEINHSSEIEENAKSDGDDDDDEVVASKTLDDDDDDDVITG